MKECPTADGINCDAGQLAHRGEGVRDVSV